MRAASLAIAMMAAVSLTACKPSADKDQADVAAASAAWDGAFNAGDLTKLADRYEDDAVSMPPGASPLTGKAAIQADFAGFFAKNRGEHHTMSPVRRIEGDVAIERGSYQLIITPKDGGAPQVERGKHIVVYHRQKEGGGWKVTEEIWNAGQ